MSPKDFHPTKVQLIEVAVKFLDENRGQRPTVDEVLAISGISRGSLYHHFADYEELIQEAELVQFSRFVEVTSTQMSGLLGSVHSPAELRDALFAITVATQSNNGAKSRLLRSRIIGDAEHNIEFQKKLQVEVDRLTDTLEVLIQAAIDKGWFKKTYPARVIAVFIQAYTLGKVLNDLSANKVAEADWNTLINNIIADQFINL